MVCPQVAAELLSSSRGLLVLGSLNGPEERASARHLAHLLEWPVCVALTHVKDFRLNVALCIMICAWLLFAVAGARYRDARTRSHRQHTVTSSEGSAYFGSELSTCYMGAGLPVYRASLRHHLMFCFRDIIS